MQTYAWFTHQNKKYRHRFGDISPVYTGGKKTVVSPVYTRGRRRPGFSLELKIQTKTDLNQCLKGLPHHHLFSSRILLRCGHHSPPFHNCSLWRHSRQNSKIACWFLLHVEFTLYLLTEVKEAGLIKQKVASIQIFPSPVRHTPLGRRDGFLPFQIHVTGCNELEWNSNPVIRYLSPCRHYRASTKGLHQKKKGDPSQVFSRT